MIMVNLVEREGGNVIGVLTTFVKNNRNVRVVRVINQGIAQPVSAFG
jgi:hypothetical protein